MKKIALFTSNRSEFSACYSLIKEINKKNNLEYFLFVGGTHLVEEYGKTITEINDSKLIISDYFDYVSSSSSNTDIAKSVAKCTLELSKIFNKYTFDFVFLIGDRLELLSIAQVALVYNKAMIHVSGGEITMGAIDDQIRNMLSKCSHLHFVSCEEYANNLKKMGEQTSRIHNVGELTIDSIVECEKISKTKLFNELGLNEKLDTVLLTFHPVTKEIKIPNKNKIKNIMSVLNEFNYQVLITAPTHDSGRDEIMNEISNFIKTNNNFYFIESLGFNRYYNLITHCKFIIGNSSSGISEVPFFKIPTINIGDRQKGRIRHSSVIDSGFSKKSIRESVIMCNESIFIKNLTKSKFKFNQLYIGKVPVFPKLK